MNKYAKRKDSNHNEIKQAFTDAGWSWFDLFRFPGQLDGEAIKRGSRGTYCVIRVEVKMLGEVLTPAEEKFIDAWPGLVLVAYTPTDALYRADRMLAAY